MRKTLPCCMVWCRPCWGGGSRRSTRHRACRSKTSSRATWATTGPRSPARTTGSSGRSLIEAAGGEAEICSPQGSCFLSFLVLHSRLYGNAPAGRSAAGGSRVHLAAEAGGGQRLAERGGAGVKGVTVAGLGFGRFVGHVADEGVELGGELWARLGELHGQQELEAGGGAELRGVVGEGDHVLPDGSVHQFGQPRTVLGER